jgi:two-component system, chemotaxis family, sensor kinase CheA
VTDLSDLAELYKSESRDHLAQLGRAVLSLEGTESKAAVDEAFRAAHTLKGMAAMMGHESVVGLAHGLEHLLDNIRGGMLSVDGGVVDTILAAVDELGRVVELAVGSQDETERAVAASVGRAPTLGRRETSLAGGNVPHPTSHVARPVSGRPSFVRVDQGRIDSLMDRAGELVSARERVLLRARESGDRQLQAEVASLGRALHEIREDALRLRLAPLGDQADRIQRIVRDTARAVRKEVRLELSGAEVEVDRALLGDLGDLLTHLLRNAVDHGIESPEGREAAGKPTIGLIHVSASQDRDTVTIRVEDDGRGIDVERVRAKALAQGRDVVGGVSTAKADLLQLLTAAGFSTAAAVTEISGRGVGLDHVANRLREIRGDLRIESDVGRGTAFIMRLPKTLSLTRVLLMGCGKDTIAIPAAGLERIDDRAGPANGTADAITRRRATDVPTYDLAKLFGDKEMDARSGDGYQVVLEQNGRRVKLEVDTLLGLQDAVIKRFAVPRSAPDLFSGATILTDGRPCLVVDPARLIAALSVKTKAEA